MAKYNSVKVGIVGAGRIGNLHAQHLARYIPEADAAAIADIVLTKAENAAEKYHIAQSTADYQRLLHDNSIKAIIICSTTDTHTQIIEDAASAGKHIFCEKPIALDISEIKHALNKVEEAGVKFQVGFNRRFDPNFQKIKQEVSAGKLGTPQILRITSRDPEPPDLEYLQSSGGLFLDMTIHDFDMARHVVESDVREVFAMGDVLVNSRFKAANDIDTAITTLRFENGALGSIDNSRQAVYGYDQRVEVFGSKGMVKVSNPTPDQHMLMNAERVQSSKPLYFFMQRYKESFIAEMRSFIEAIVNDTDTPVPGIDGLIAVRIALAARKSLEENRVVKVSEIPI